MTSPRPAAAAPSPYALRSIADVERETGLPRATIRIWERRYGFPAPQRDDRGERCYPEEQVAQLKLMRRLIEQGHRPARLLAADAAELRRLGALAAAAPARRSRGVTQLLALLREHDAAALRKELLARLAGSGLAEFVAGEVPALARAVGDAWLAGELQIHEEHLFSDCVYAVLRPEIAKLEGLQRPEAPRAVLTTFEQESHGMGLLLAHAMLALQGCPAVSLGVRLPLAQIAAAARAHRADLVGLSFTASMNGTHILRGLEELRGMLPVQVRIWAGGSAPALARRRIAGVRMVDDVRDVPLLLAEDFALPPLE